jgi:hypothetical protein
MIKYKLKLGNGTIEAECQDMKSAHKFGTVYGAIPKACDACKSEDIFLSHRCVQENNYYFIACKDCGAEFSLHEYKKGGFYITENDKFKVYQKNEDSKKSSEKPSEAEEKEMNGIF